MGFNISEYASRMSNDINDIFYAKDNSLDSKVERIRNLAEIIGRFILDWGTDKSTTLGNINEELKRNEKNPLIINAIAVINTLGVNYAHTQVVEPASEKMIEKGKNALNDMYAFLFIRYFQKYEFGSNERVERVFSLLPPVIRFKCLSYLYENGGKNNREIIMKLILACLKSSNEKKAKKWLEAHRGSLEEMASTLCDNMKNRFGDSWQNYFCVDDMPLNFYDECLLKINQVSYLLKNNGRMYGTFEEAAHFYELNGKINIDTMEINEFNRNMEFVYAGRKAIDNEKNPDNYVTANIWSVNKIR